MPTMAQAADLAAGGNAAAGAVAGAFELEHDHASGTWTLARVLD